jgi:HEAT repeat protein
MSSRRNRGDGGFWEFVKNPKFRKGIEAAARSRAADRPGSINLDTLSLTIARFLVREPDENLLEAIGRLGPAAVPALVGALHDPRFHEHSYGESGLDGSALNLVLELLEPHGPPEAVAPLAPLVRHRNAKVRKEAALALGNIGTEDCLEPLIVALSDSDESVRSYALMGLRRGIKAGRASRALLDSVFEPVARSLRDPESFTVCEEAALALVEIDRERATRSLLDDHVLSRSTPYVYKVIEAAVAKQVAIPPARLFDLLDDLRADVLSYPNYYTYGEALYALAVAGDPRAEGLIREAMPWDNGTLAKRAAAALGVLSGVPDPFGTVARLYDRGGLDALTDPQRLFFTVSVFRKEVSNGGLAQYFVNSWGNDARVALAGLEAIGATQAASVLRQAMALFGADGPSLDRDKRHDQLASLTELQDAEMEALTTALFRDDDRVELRLLEYARQHL